MLTRQQVTELSARIASQNPPVLSLYSNVNPTRPENNPRANALRVKDTLKQINAPAELVEEATSIVGKLPQARTLAIFGRPGQLEIVPLQVDLPVIASNGHVEAHYGDPYLAPLELALDEYERYAVLYVDSQRFRLFEVFLGEIEEVSDAFRPHPPRAEDRLLHARRTHPAYIASRDTSGKDRVARRMDSWTYRFYKHAAHELETLIRGLGIDRLVLIGPDEDVCFFESVMSKALHERVVARLPSLSSPEAPPCEVYARVAPVIGQVEAEEEARLLDQIRERGTWGIERCLEELLQGRLHVIAVPFDLDQSVWMVPELDFVTVDEATARSQGNGYAVERRQLRAILPELAASYGARIEFLRGSNAERVRSELSGMAGLLRW